MVKDQREHFIPRAIDPDATWGEFPPADERLPVSAEVMALLETDFPEAAPLFQVDPMWLENYRYPQRWLLGFDGSKNAEASLVFAESSATGNIRILPEPRNELEGDIRADERKLICAQEGHNEVDTTTLGSPGRDSRCVRCGYERSEPRPVYCSCEWIDVTSATAEYPAKASVPGRKDPSCPVHGQDGP